MAMRAAVPVPEFSAGIGVELTVQQAMAALNLLCHWCGPNVGSWVESELDPACRAALGARNELATTLHLLTGYPVRDLCDTRFVSEWCEEVLGTEVGW